MKQVAAMFHEDLGLDPHQVAKAFMFIAKALAGTGFVFVLGQLSVAQSLTGVVALVLILSVSVDISCELYTVKVLTSLPENIRELEQAHLIFLGAAYTILLTTALSSLPPLRGYIFFMVLWAGSFLLEFSALFIMDAPDRS